jgi:hypothetical protein
MSNQTNDSALIHELLNKLQMGYTHRGVSQIDEFMQMFIQDDSLEIIGTSASWNDRSEWCVGPAMARELFLSDWEYWGNLLLNLDSVKIQIHNDVSWISIPGQVEQDFNRKDQYENYLEFVKSYLEKEIDPEEKILRIQLGCANTFYELQRGEHFTWPIVLTAVLVKQSGRWLFQQMRFGFPTTRFPDERVQPFTRL